MSNGRGGQRFKKDSAGGARKKDGGPGGPGGGMRRRKLCRFCVDKIDFVDYKDIRLMMLAIPERAKIQPRRLSGTCAKHQRKLTTAVKRARQLALIPYVTD